jgi:dihydrodipicolinate reductase
LVIKWLLTCFLAQKKAQAFDSLDQEAEQEEAAQQKKVKERMKSAREERRKKEAALTGGLVVGHSKDAFMDGTETILVLQDKSESTCFIAFKPL